LELEELAVAEVPTIANLLNKRSCIGDEAFKIGVQWFARRSDKFDIVERCNALWIFFEESNERCQFVREVQVVVVQETNIATLYVPQGCVLGDRRFAPAMLMADDPHARVALGSSLQQSERPIGRAVIDDDEFQIRMRLLQHRVDRGFDVALAVVAGNDDGDERRGDSKGHVKSAAESRS
jgi:hypothetical protein